MNLNEFVNKLTSFKYGFSNEIQVGNSKIYFRVYTNEGYSSISFDRIGYLQEGDKTIVEFRKVLKEEF